MDQILSPPTVAGVLLRHDMMPDRTGWTVYDALESRPVRLSSHLLVGPRMAVSFGIEFPDGVVDGLIEVFRSGEGLVSEVMPLQIAPDPFKVVQLWGVFRQPLDREPGGALGERRTGRLAGVDRAVVEDEHDGLEHHTELGPIAPIDLLQESDEGER